jgi:clan AA aspartic protease (TIGR02281 family)
MHLRGVCLAGVILVTAASAPVHAQSKLAQSTPSEGVLKNKITSEYQGQYFCLQGTTSLTIQMLKPEAGSEAAAIFRFGPSSANPSVPYGAFLLRGIMDLRGGRLDLRPLSWLSQPPGYVMVGLSGTSSDGGSTFDGTVYGGVGCTAFSLSRVSTSSTFALPTISRQQPRTALPSTAPSPQDRVSEIPLKTRNGVFVVPVQINGALTLDFMVDSGASDVIIPADVVLTLMRTGTLRDTDFLGQKSYRLADGSAVPSQTFRIRILKVGDRQIENVMASVARVEGSLLLGQSFLSRFRSWSINNGRQVLVLE